MDIQFCTASYFFNISQRFQFVVYDFREKPTQQLKNTLLTYPNNQIKETSELEQHIKYPDVATEKYQFKFIERKRLQLLFKNRKRNYNFFLPFESTDLFTLFLSQHLALSRSEDKITLSSDNLQQLFHDYQKQFKRPQRMGRAQTMIQKEPSSEHISVTENEINQQKAKPRELVRKDSIVIQHKGRNPSAPELKPQTKPNVSNIDMFQQCISILSIFNQEKFRQLYVIVDTCNIIFQNYPYLNYLNQRNKYFLDKSFPNAIIDNKLYLGAAEHARDVEMLQDQLKITHILNATIEVQNYCEKINYLNIRIYDEVQVQIKDHFEEAYQFINDAFDNGGKILVHCAQGKSRSACFVTMFLMRKFNWGFEQAYEYVKDKRDVVQINDGFIEQLQQLDIK